MRFLLYHQAAKTLPYYAEVSDENVLCLLPSMRCLQPITSPGTTTATLAAAPPPRVREAHNPDEGCRLCCVDCMMPVGEYST